METNSNYKPICNINLNLYFTKAGVIKIHANYNYSYTDNNKYSHIYYFFSNKVKFNEIQIDHNSNIVIDNFSIPSIESSEITIIIYLVDKNNNNSNVTLYDYNTIEIFYSDFVNASKIDENITSNLEKIDENKENITSNLEKIDESKENITSNLEKIDKNKEDILLLQNNNVKAFYNLDKRFIYDIPKGHQNVDKDNYYHMFEKEIIYNFIKDSYLEIILKVLTEIANYVLIGYFQILCNFHDENDDLFYTISLLTAMGSINKLSTIKSVFMVPINKSTNKIKTDFLLCLKNQQNRPAKFIIYDINSNKIYMKYYQRTDEMSIKNIEDSLNTVNNISANLNK